MMSVLLTACTDDKKPKNLQTKELQTKELQESEKIKKPVKDLAVSSKQKDAKKKSKIALLGQLHNDTILRQVRLPRYDENFNPLSLLHAERMEVIAGQTIEARDVSLELYNQDGSVQARTKVRRAIYHENDAILKAEEAIYISGEDFKASGSGMVYDINTGQGFIVGPASSLFYLKALEASDPKP
jgi:hypothetical protein